MALSAAVTRKYYADQRLRSFPVQAATRIWKGGLVGLHIATKNLRPYTAGDYFVGIAAESIDNLLGASGAVDCDVETMGDFELPIAAATQADVGKLVEAVADDAIQFGSTINRVVGKIIGIVSATVVIVRLKPFLNESTI